LFDLVSPKAISKSGGPRKVGGVGACENIIFTGVRGFP
jgi:hypothetical protein